jgi:hypothetical protein
MEGHHKNQCPAFNYFSIGASNPLAIGGGVWCDICRIIGHHPTTFLLIQKYQTIARNLFCIFCKSIGHEKKDSRTVYLMRECTLDAYIIQWEDESEGWVPQYNTLRIYNQGGREGFISQGRGLFNRGRGLITFYNCNQPGHLVRDCLNPYPM